MVDKSNQEGILTSGFPPLTYRAKLKDPHFELHWAESYERASWLEPVSSNSAKKRKDNIVY